MDTLPETGFLRLNQFLGTLIPLGKTRWFEGVRRGEFPKPKKVGRASLYKVEDIKSLIEKLANSSQ